jgi:ATP synthase protein I
MIEPGRGGAYIVLFSEIGISLLITTLLGVVVGYWVDQRLGTIPIFVLIGFFVGAGAGALTTYRLVMRFLKATE